MEKVGFGSLAGSYPLKPKGEKKPFRKILIPKCLVVTDVCVNGPFVRDTAQQEATPVGGSYSQLLRFVCRVRLAALVGLLLAFFPFLSLSALLLCFTSLNSCLSETSSLGPRSTAVAMATAFILPPLGYSQEFGFCSQTGGKVAIQESPPLQMAIRWQPPRPVYLLGRSQLDLIPCSRCF